MTSGQGDTSCYLLQCCTGTLVSQSVLEALRFLKWFLFFLLLRWLNATVKGVEVPVALGVQLGGSAEDLAQPLGGHTDPSARMSLR